MKVFDNRTVLQGLKFDAKLSNRTYEFTIVCK